MLKLKLAKNNVNRLFSIMEKGQMSDIYLQMQYSS